MKRNLLYLSQQLYCKPLLISRPGFCMVSDFLQKAMNGDMDPEDMDPEDMPMRPEMYMDNNVAYIPIVGPIGRHLSMMDKVCGATDIEELRDNIDLAKTYPDCEQLCFVVDSPGGSVEGVPELAEYIADVHENQMDCIAKVDGICASAAYWLISGCGEIVAKGKTCTVGSTGAYTYLLDESRAFQNAGYEPVLIKSGEHKGDLLPGLKITDEQKAALQKECNYIGDMFRSFVAQHRPSITQEDLKLADAYFTEEALQRGFIDRIIKNDNELFN